MEKAITKQIADNRLRIGQQLASAREAKGLTQQQVADLTGLQRPHIARAEGGRYNVGIDVLAKITAAIGAEIHITRKIKAPVGNDQS
jgi:transcriptional regulator with XRE-family HTH domain